MEYKVSWRDEMVKGKRRYFCIGDKKTNRDGNESK